MAKIIALKCAPPINSYCSVWRQYGLKEAPPKLTAEEKEQLIKKYVEQGVFNAPLSTNEVFHYTVVNPRLAIKHVHGAPWDV